MGFEPMLRVLQTLALPLGHVAVKVDRGDKTPCLKQERATGLEPVTFSLARRHSTN